MTRSLPRLLRCVCAGWALIMGLSGAASCSDGASCSDTAGCSDPEPGPCTDFCKAALACDVPSSCALADQDAVLTTCRIACEKNLSESAPASCVACVGGETIRVNGGAACGLSPQVVGETGKSILENCGCQTRLEDFQSALAVHLGGLTCESGRPLFGWDCTASGAGTSCSITCSLSSTQLGAMCTGPKAGPLGCACASGKTFAMPSCAALYEDRSVLDHLWETCR